MGTKSNWLLLHSAYDFYFSLFVPLFYFIHLPLVGKVNNFMISQLCLGKVIHISKISHFIKMCSMYRDVDSFLNPGGLAVERCS